MASEMASETERASRILIHAGAAHDDVEKQLEFDSRETMTQINSKLEHVLDRAPSDATANLLLKRSKDGYRAFFKIHSAQRKFVGFISGKTLVDTVDKVLSQVRSQIDEWKEKRRIAEESL